MKATRAPEVAAPVAGQKRHHHENTIHRPAKLLAVFVADTDDKELTTPAK